MIIVNNLCDFHDLYTSLSVTFVFFNRQNKDIYFIYDYYHVHWVSANRLGSMLVECLETQGLACSSGVYHTMGRHVGEVSMNPAD